MIPKKIIVAPEHTTDITYVMFTRMAHARMAARFIMGPLFLSFFLSLFLSFWLFRHTTDISYMMFTRMRLDPFFRLFFSFSLFLLSFSSSLFFLFLPCLFVQKERSQHGHVFQQRNQKTYIGQTMCLLNTLQRKSWWKYEKKKK